MFNMESPPGLRGLAQQMLLLATLSPSLSSAAVLDLRDPVPAGYVAAPYYPAPYGGWDSSWSSAYEKAVALVSQMTVAEKVNITGGTGLYMVSGGFPSLPQNSVSLPPFLRERLADTISVLRVRFEMIDLESCSRTFIFSNQCLLLRQDDASATQAACRAWVSPTSVCKTDP
jgi:hypothetical protein